MSKDLRLNVQGTARRDKGFQSCIIADPGEIIVSCDLASGEPTATAHFSKDKNYYDACFGMVGKEPYYDNEILKIDDIYLTGASFSPMGASIMEEAFNSTYSGNSFQETWLSDPGLIKKELKEVRAFHKQLVLAIGYSMGPRKMVSQSYDSGIDLDLKDARTFYKEYWKWAADVRRLSDRLATQVRGGGSLVNIFGYRLVPSQDYKAFNYYIQSTVSGMMNVLVWKFLSVCEYAKFITIIHDEIVFSVPKDKEKEAQVMMQQAEDSLNKDLGWDVKVRCGWESGNNFYEAK